MPEAFADPRPGRRVTLQEGVPSMLLVQPLRRLFAAEVAGLDLRHALREAEFARVAATREGPC